MKNLLKLFKKFTWTKWINPASLVAIVVYIVFVHQTTFYEFATWLYVTGIIIIFFSLGQLSGEWRFKTAQKLWKKYREGLKGNPTHKEMVEADTSLTKLIRLFK